MIQIGVSEMKKSLIKIAAASLLVISLAGCSAGKYKDGTYTATARGNASDIKLNINVKGGKIKNIDIVEHKETAELIEGAKNVMLPAIVKKQSTEGVDTVSGATKTSEAILKAVNEALGKAEK